MSALGPAAAGLIFLLAVGVEYKPEDPIPPGATGKILPVSGKVLELRGLALGVAGEVSPVEAALKDLGAKVTEFEIRIELSADVLFDFDKADLRGETKPVVLNTKPGGGDDPDGRQKNRRVEITLKKG